MEYEPIFSKWNDEKKTHFSNRFDSARIREAKQMLNILANGRPNQSEMDNITKIISDIPITAGLESGLAKQITNNRNFKEPKSDNKPWFDRECQIRRDLYTKIRNRLKKRKSFQDIAALRNESKAYKKFINRKRHLFNKKNA